MAIMAEFYEGVEVIILTLNTWLRSLNLEKANEQGEEWMCS